MTCGSSTLPRPLMAPIWYRAIELPPPPLSSRHPWPGSARREWRKRGGADARSQFSPTPFWTAPRLVANSTETPVQNRMAGNGGFRSPVRQQEVRDEENPETIQCPSWAHCVRGCQLVSGTGALCTAGSPPSTGLGKCLPQHTQSIYLPWVSSRVTRRPRQWGQRSDAAKS